MDEGSRVFKRECNDFQILLRASTQKTSRPPTNTQAHTHNHWSHDGVLLEVGEYNITQNIRTECDAVWPLKGTALRQSDSSCDRVWAPCSAGSGASTSKVQGEKTETRQAETNCRKGGLESKETPAALRLLRGTAAAFDLTRNFTQER